MKMKMKKMAFKKKNMDKIINYVFIFALIALLVYTVFYIFNVVRATKETFIEVEEEIEERFAEEPTYKVVYVYSNNCGYCTRFTPVFDSFVTNFAKSGGLATYSAEISKVEVHDLVDGKFNGLDINVEAFPTILVFKQDKSNETYSEYKKIVGASDLTSLQTQLLGFFKV